MNYIFSYTKSLENQSMAQHKLAIVDKFYLFKAKKKYSKGAF